MIVAEPKTEAATTGSETSCIYGDDCPMYAENPSFNAETLAAMQEARDMASGKIPGKWLNSIAALALREVGEGQDGPRVIACRCARQT